MFSRRSKNLDDEFELYIETMESSDTRELSA